MNPIIRSLELLRDNLTDKLAVCNRSSKPFYEYYVCNGRKEIGNYVLEVLEEILAMPKHYPEELTSKKFVADLRIMLEEIAFEPLEPREAQLELAKIMGRRQLAIEILRKMREINDAANHNPTRASWKWENDLGRELEERRSI